MYAHIDLQDRETQSDVVQEVNTLFGEDEAYPNDLWNSLLDDLSQSAYENHRVRLDPQVSAAQIPYQKGAPGAFSEMEVVASQQPYNVSDVHQSWRSLQKIKGLPRQRSKYATARVQQPSDPISMTRSSMSFHNDNDEADILRESDPLERWRDSPPEYEPAAMTAIHQALIDGSIQPHNQPVPWMQASGCRKTSFTTDPVHFRQRRPRSSAGTSESGLSDSSAKSVASDNPRNRARLQNRRTRKGRDKVDRDRDDREKRRFKCTFCCDDFRTKYDWARHEKSLHLDVEEWRCIPYGSMTFSPLTEKIQCAFCNALDPSDEHLGEHGHELCNNPNQPTTFHRKDHLVQHLRLVHKLLFLPSIDDWKVNSAPLSARCGFCNLTMRSWDERTSHLSEHFRQGSDMTHWQGDHDFDKVTALKVRNAIPPYCIGDESSALVPFRPTDSQTQDHFNQISYSINNMNLGPTEIKPTDVGPVPESDGTVDTLEHDSESKHIRPNSGAYIDMLASHLGRFAREQMMLGNVPTDDMFRAEARRAIYDSQSDGWDTTVADNDHWLRSFKEQLGPFH